MGADTAKSVAGGWGWPARANKAHFFQKGRSLCGQWMWIRGDLEAGEGSPNDCRKCTRKLARLEEKAAERESAERFEREQEDRAEAEVWREMMLDDEMEDR